MTAFNRRYDDPKYVNGFVYSAADFEFLDINLTKTLNGRGGGTWNPGALLEIGPTGAGVWFAMSVVLGAGIHILATSGNSLTHDDSDFPLRSQTIARISQTIDGRAGPPASIGRSHRNASPDWVLPGAALGYVESAHLGEFNDTPASWWFPLRVIDGSSLTQVTFYFQITEAHAAPVPVHPIRFAVWQVDQDGERVALLTGADADGYVTINASAYLSVLASSQVIPAMATINTSVYSYQAEIVDEYGTNSWSTTGNNFFAAEGSFSLTDDRPQ